MITKEDIEKTVDVVCSISETKKPHLKVKTAKFECPSCGSVMSVLQLDEKFREPTRCGCGRRGGFKIISKEVVEAQDIKIREKDSGFEYKVYLEGKKIIDTLKSIEDTSSITIKGEVQDEYKKNSTKGELVIYAKKIEQKKEEKPNFLR